MKLDPLFEMVGPTVPRARPAEKRGISSAEFLASEHASKLPDWVKYHLDWKHYTTIDKTFPGLGLKNCREPHPTEIMDYGTQTPISKKMDICFSSDGVEGMWDIATMSMRGAMSCRHWDNPHAKGSYNLLADMASPHMGIIYFTDGTMTPYGLSMNKRALVRYVPYNGPPLLGASCILLDRVYIKSTNRDPLKYVNIDPDPNTRDIFKNFMKSKLTNKAKANTSVR